MAISLTTLDGKLARAMEPRAAAAAAHGAEAAGTILLRLPLELGPLVEDWLNRHFPDKAKHVLSLVRQARGGKIYSSEWGQRMTGTGPYADLLHLRFEKACKRLGLNRRRTAFDLDKTQFRKPAKTGDQLSLL
ncbi:MAG TPA: hypothetical protein VIJ42_01325 [Stellaceae bacterium]